MEFYDFYYRYRDWIDQDDPSYDFRFWTLIWLSKLQDDPVYAATRARELGEPWWFARIPNAEDDRRAVVSLYSIDIATERVRCSSITTLSKPIAN